MSIPKKNDRYIVEIVDFTSEGFGVCRVNNFTIFVENTCIGDIVEITIVKVKKTYGYAKILRINEPSENRVKAPCEHSNTCGGCTIQHIDYDEQLRIKTKIVDDCLKRIGKFDAVNTCKAIGSGKQFKYRNKAQFPVATVNKELVCGFYAKRSHRIIGITECLLQYDINTKIIEIILRYMKQFHIPAYNEETHTGIIRHIVTRTAQNTNEVIVTIVINSDFLKKSEELVDELMKLNGMKSVCLSINKNRSNVIMGNKLKILLGEGFITDFIGDLKFRISAGSFFQVNPDMTKLMYDKAIELLCISSNDTVIDCYCGIGTISLYAAKYAKNVIGIEVVSDAIEDAKQNALLNNITNAEFVLGYAEEELKLFAQKGFNADVVILDPPRSGCDEKLIRSLAEILPDRIAYISCNPATMARDLKLLCELKDYTVKVVQPFDMFCNTMGVESVALVERC